MIPILSKILEVVRFARAASVAYYEPAPSRAVILNPCRVTHRTRNMLAHIEARFYMTNKKLVLTTAPSLEESKRIARELVERRLASCVNIIPKIESVYRWEGKVEEAQEFLLLIKTTEDARPRVQEAIQQLHSYELPECIALSIDEGSPAYLKWMDDSVE
jgi:periplasmic divalent cation tolerance protein